MYEFATTYSELDVTLYNCKHGKCYFKAEHNIFCFDVVIMNKVNLNSFRFLTSMLPEPMRSWRSP